ncbi:distal membrane-arm assembly complex protein 2 [Microplitis demolitor]|uniref:distal membrane-arm assembly complex protein 2 n=1 Tax=Microplitis demolitor TaxID=69319 RepID=UPI0004CDBB5E|nr:distal membrane-arm assembly complex protein 2 [Microplitis demolitor]
MFLNKAVTKLHGSAVNSLQIFKRLATYHPDYYKSPEAIQREQEEADEPRPRRKLKKWRRMPGELPVDESFLGMFNNQADRDDAGGFIFRGKSLKFTDLMYSFKLRRHEYLQFDQKYLIERNQVLGNDLAAVHFVVYRKGKFRKKGETEMWDISNLDVIPNTYQPDWYVDEIDVSNTDIVYEGIENFKHLKWLKKLTFKNCKHFDDWCLDRVVGLCPTIEYLDISECEKVTERGLEALYRAWNLKDLIVTDHYHNPAFELTCMMIEDCLPDLKIHIKKAPKKEPEQDLSHKDKEEQEEVQEKEALQNKN